MPQKGAIITDRFGILKRLISGAALLSCNRCRRLLNKDGFLFFDAEAVLYFCINSTSQCPLYYSLEKGISVCVKRISVEDAAKAKST